MATAHQFHVLASASTCPITNYVMAPSSQRSKSASRRPKNRNGHIPLAEDLTASGPLRTKSKKRKVGADNDDEFSLRGNDYVDARSSRKILKIGQDLQEEEVAEHKSNLPNPAFTFESRFGGDDRVESEDELLARRHTDYEDDGEEAWGSDSGHTADKDDTLDPHDLSLFEKFNPTVPPTNHDPVIQQPSPSHDNNEETINLADLILSKIALHEAATANSPSEPREPPNRRDYDDDNEPPPLPPKVIEVYTTIGTLLSRYKSGKLPKPFKVLPTLPAHPTLLSLTNPDAWTPNAVFEATRLFVSSNPSTCQGFITEILLPRVRDDIHETKHLNVHLFNSLKKSLYKPACFFKGFLFPLVGSGTCSLREAHIISSVLTRVSVPVLHSAAALLRLTELAAEQTMQQGTEAAGASNVFIRVLLEKKYALPYKVIDGLVFHFLRYRGGEVGGRAHDAGGQASGGGPTKAEVAEHEALAAREAKLPLLWHRCLLAFAQRYRNDITEDQREALLDLLLVRGHRDIGPEVRRELLAGRGRGVVVEEGVAEGGDDTMMDLR